MMKKLLHIIVTPRGNDSSTLKVSKAFLAEFSKKYPDCIIDELSVATAKLPDLAVEEVSGKYMLLSGKELSGKPKEAWKKIEAEIARFLAADAYLVSVPMWNFSIPYMLKHYIDVIVQPKYLFRYTASGVEGLAKNKKMVVVASRGGDYSPGSPGQASDFQEPYLRTVFGFVGITDITFLIAQPMNMGPELAEKKLQETILKAKQAAQNF
jgi:FMN-dependent NADH-azoreductase